MTQPESHKLNPAAHTPAARIAFALSPVQLDISNAASYVSRLRRSGRVRTRFGGTRGTGVTTREVRAARAGGRGF